LEGDNRGEGGGEDRYLSEGERIKSSNSSNISESSKISAELDKVELSLLLVFVEESGPKRRGSMLEVVGLFVE